MRSFVSHHLFYVLLAALGVGTAGYFVYQVAARDPLAGRILATVDSGTVETIVSVSGVTKSPSTATLAFPTSGVVAAIKVTEGTTVAAGDILATLGSSRETATLARAEAEVSIAQSALAELLAGATDEARTITSTTVKAAAAELARITAANDIAVANAQRALYSATLTAIADDPNEDAPAPVITGSYTCADPGTYFVRVYNSSAPSGYSISLSGLEGGTYTLSTSQPAPLGTCGLFAEFASTGRYSNSLWEITIPNTKNPQYTTLNNALTTAKDTRTRAIAAATEALALAEQQQSLENAAPRTTTIAAAEARVALAKAARAEIAASLADRVIVAPFAGVITAVDILQGEIANTTPVITLLATDNFEIIAHIPEIDITKVAVGQTARITFDASPEAILPATVSFVSPLPTEINGVSYYEVKLLLTTTPPWLRAGLNADVDIVIDSLTDTTRIPRRFLANDAGVYTVQLLSGSDIATSTVTVRMIGNDGFAAVSGLTVGDTIVAP